MFEIKSLKNIPFEKLYNASKLGFFEYEFNVNITQQELKTLFNSYGYSEELSLGAFVKDKIIGFSFNGINESEKTAYNAGIAVLPGFRGQGIGKSIIKSSIEKLKEAGIKKYILECIEDNEDAYNFYLKFGFSLNRTLICFSATKKRIKQLKAKNCQNFLYANESNNILSELNIHADSQQSWQYSDFAIMNVPECYSILTARTFDKKLAGLIVYDKTLGAIAKLVIDKNFRRQGLATSLLIKASDKIEATEITFINIDDKNEGIKAFLKKKGFKPFAKQFELYQNL